MHVYEVPVSVGGHGVAPFCPAEAVLTTDISLIMELLIRGSVFGEESMFNSDPSSFQRPLQAQVSLA